MESVENGKDALLSGIEADVRAEEKQILEDAQKQIEDKKKYAEKKIESILEEAQVQAKERAEAIKNKVLSGVGIEIKRGQLKAQDEIVHEIIAMVEKKLEAMMSEDGYRKYMIEWASEAAMGLDVDSASINASAKERPMLDEQFLNEISENVERCGGKKVALKLSDDDPLKFQGVVLVADDGRTAFNNQIKTRMMRKTILIRKVINDTLFSND